MLRIKRFLPGQTVKLLSRNVLIEAGYPENDDKEDFLNILAGKTVTLEKSFEDGEIYTCVEFPEIAIYRVFIDRIENFDDFSFKEITLMMGFKTSDSNTRKMFKTACSHIERMIQKDFF